MRHVTLSRPYQPEDHDNSVSTEKIASRADIQKKNQSIDENK